MILDFTQWTRLQNNVKRELSFFKDKDIKPVKQKGIVISKTEYIPVSVEF